MHSTARCCLHVQHQLGYQRQCQSYRNARLGWASEALALCLPFEHFPDFSSIHGLDIQCAALTATRLNVRVRILGRVFRAARLTPFSWHSWRQRNQDDSGRRRTRVGGISENMVFRFERPSVHACPCLKCSLPGSRMLRVLNGPAWRPPVGTAICADGFARRTTRRRALATCSQAHAGRSLYLTRRMVDSVRETDRALLAAVDDSAFDSSMVPLRAGTLADVPVSPVRTATRHAPGLEAPHGSLSAERASLLSTKRVQRGRHFWIDSS